MYKINQGMVNRVIFSVSALFISITLSGCMQSNASTTASHKPPKFITDNTLKTVNAAFYQIFVLGDWRYKGARNRGGTINAYIQIPGPLDMSKDVQKSYLQKAICPSSANSSMWKEISGIPLSVHIYTHRQKNSLHVNCIDPFIRAG